MQDEIAASFTTQVLPKKDLVILKPGMLLERDGKRYAVADGVETEIGPHLTVVFDGEPMDQAHLDVVIVCQGVLVKKSILMPNGKVAVAKVALGEVARMPLVEFLSRADTVIRESTPPA